MPTTVSLDSLFISTAYQTRGSGVCAETVADCGVVLYDTRHLSVTFRAKIGMSPVEYRDCFRPD